MKSLHELFCEQCKILFLRTNRDMKQNPDGPYFCSRKCSGLFHRNRIHKPCGNCNTIIMRRFSEIKKSYKNVFCNSSCAAKYNNQNKTSGCQRSKLEIFIESKITEIYPDLEVLYNNLYHGYEFDIRIPSLNLAIEFNGIFHYQPIFGQQKLDRTIIIDSEKEKLSLQHNFNLIIIPCLESSLKSISLKEKYWKKVENIIINNNK